MIRPTAPTSNYASIVGFAIALPITIATYYQSFKTRQEARREREGTLHSQDCLEFVAGNGNCINLVPLETLHSLPRAADGVGPSKEFLPGAYLVESVEHIYTKVEQEGSRPQEARLTKAVAKVTSLNPVIAA